MKDILRDALYFSNWLLGGDGTFSAEAGTLKYKILVWLYGDPLKGEL